ncbi:hypothetical protein D3C84_800590 [compost metagenome]
MLAFGGTAQGATPRRCSMRSNQGAMSSGLWPCTPCSLAQCCRVCSGVRKLEAQLIRVVPPTARPCMMVMAPSLLMRPMPS